MLQVSSYISARARVEPSNHVTIQMKRLLWNSSTTLKVVRLKATTPCHLSPFPHFPGLLCPQPHRHPPCQATKVPAAMEAERRKPLDLGRERPSKHVHLAC